MLILKQIYIVNFGQNKVKIGNFYNISNLNKTQKRSKKVVKLIEDNKLDLMKAPYEYFRELRWIKGAVKL